MFLNKYSPDESQDTKFKRAVINTFKEFKEANKLLNELDEDINKLLIEAKKTEN